MNSNEEHRIEMANFVNRYGIYVPHITTDMFHLSSTLSGPFLIHDLSPDL
jgi:hypothetical protein